MVETVAVFDQVRAPQRTRLSTNRVRSVFGSCQENYRLSHYLSLIQAPAGTHKNTLTLEGLEEVGPDSRLGAAGI